MSLKKGIEHKKEKRKPYKGVKKYCAECRNHGSCDYCKNNRLYQSMKMREKTEYDLKVYDKRVGETASYRRADTWRSVNM